MLLPDATGGNCFSEEVDEVKLKALWKSYLQAAESNDYKEVSNIDLKIHNDC